MEGGDRGGGDWFHGQMSRLEAEDVLKDHDFTEGLFLVRQSESAQGDFVLSVVHDNEVIHYQIRKRGDDSALFSLSEEKKVIHGLDELVHFYKNNVHSGLQHRLTMHVPGEECPLMFKLHGSENLLHRATANGNYEVVYELLKSGYQNLAAKNGDGQTAVHLAVYYGHLTILELLIKHKASTNSADLSGYSPLHLAIHGGQPEAAKILLLSGRANPTSRNRITSWTALHEGAYEGSVQCCTVLLQHGSPLRPRTKKNETPADLARANGKTDVAQMLEDWPEFSPQSNRKDWLHDGISRANAIKLIAAAKHPVVDGTFLIRKSTKTENSHVLTMFCEGEFNNFVVEKRGIYHCLDEGPYMTSLEHLVDHYTAYADGLPIKLKEGVAAPDAPPSDRPVLRPPALGPKPSSTSQLSESPPLPPRVPPARDGPGTVYPTNLRPLVAGKPYDNNETIRRVRHSRDDIPFEAIHVKDAIGEGEFGSVYKAVYMNENGNVRDVAVKIKNSDSSVEGSTMQDFIKEAQIMMALDHHCVVQFIGISKGPPVLVVLELVPLGSLLDFITNHPESVRPEMEIPLWAAQIACGMHYLEKQRFIHRDLAARNILLASKLQAKISDFGLSRVLSGEKTYYEASKGGRWPVRWYAPESISYGKFSSASDVWSFGILLWEMYTYGKQPYEGMEAHQLLKFLNSGERLAMPNTASDEVQEQMLMCWDREPDHRPQFIELLNFFAENREYSNLKELLTTQDLGALSTPDNTARLAAYDKADKNSTASAKSKPDILI